MMLKHRFLALAAAALLLVACGGGAATQPPPGAVDAEATTATQPDDGAVDRSKLSKELFFYNWSDYIDPSVLEEFEAEFGVSVVVDVYDANEDMITKVGAGGSGYDLTTPSDYAVQIMIEEGLVQPLDQSLISNIKHIKPQNMDLFFDKGNIYSVPYLFGVTGIAYNTSIFSTPPDSWAALFDPAQIKQYEANQQQFSMLDDERETPGAALKYMGKSLNTTDTAALEQVQQMLIEQKRSPAMSYNSADVNRKLASGEYVIAHAWNGMALQARAGLEGDFEGSPEIGFVVPKEGGTIWQDNLVVLADAPNAYTAHVFINYLMRPEIAARNAEYVGYLTPNGAAQDLLSTELQALYDQGFGVDDALYERLEWIERSPETATFTDLWTAVKGE